MSAWDVEVEPSIYWLGSLGEVEQRFAGLGQKGETKQIFAGLGRRVKLSNILLAWVGEVVTHVFTG